MDYQEAIYCMKVMADEEVCEECNYYQSCDHTKQSDMAKIVISAMQKLQQYEELGTLEEVREAVEKQRKVKPEDGEYCPICHTFLKDEDDVPGFYCMNCGQAIDWGEE